jgi:hypothetical protein
MTKRTSEALPQEQAFGYHYKSEASKTARNHLTWPKNNPEYSFQIALPDDRTSTPYHWTFENVVAVMLSPDPRPESLSNPLDALFVFVERLNQTLWNEHELQVEPNLHSRKLRSKAFVGDALRTVRREVSIFLGERALPLDFRDKYLAPLEELIPEMLRFVALPRPVPDPCPRPLPEDMLGYKSPHELAHDESEEALGKLDQRYQNAVIDFERGYLYCQGRDLVEQRQSEAGQRKLRNKPGRPKPTRKQMEQELRVYEHWLSVSGAPLSKGQYTAEMFVSNFPSKLSADGLRKLLNTVAKREARKK